MTNITQDEIDEADRLWLKFDIKAHLVCDEIIGMAYSGYDRDALYEIPRYEAVKKYLLEKHSSTTSQNKAE